MTSRSFDFRVADKACFTMGHPTTVTVALCLFSAGDLNVMLRLSAKDARAMAAALEAAATHAENVPSGLGESAVDAPAVQA